MHLIKLLLPLRDNRDQPFDRAAFQMVRDELTETFGGVTAYFRSPAVGLWQEDDATVNRDDVVTFEVLSAELDETWWANYRKQLEERFRQDEVLIFASAVTKL